MTAADWENPRLLGINKLPAHVPLKGARNLEDALAGKGSSVSLDGAWKFKLVGSPGAVPAGFETVEASTAGWDTVTVPHTWQMPKSGATLGEIDRPMYINGGYAMEVNPPWVGEENPTGLYRREFEVPAVEGDRVYRLVFEGVDSYLECWLNGVFVGMSKDSRLPAEFDVTAMLRPGRNVLACKVLKHCDGSYLEDQDQWRLSGIQRSVSLLSLPRVHIADLEVRAEADGELRLAARVAGASGGYTLEFHVLEGSAAVAGFPVSVQVGEILNYLPGAPMGGGTSYAGPKGVGGIHGVAGPGLAVVNARVESPKLWSAETPNLYRLVAVLRGPGGLGGGWCVLRDAGLGSGRSSLREGCSKSTGGR